jgi:CRISPR-associated endonuclease Csy4
MKYYQELTILPSYDIASYIVWGKVYQQLHLGFASVLNTEGNIKTGVSFPEYRVENGKGLLGNKLRVFAESENELKNLRLDKLLSRLNDYIHLTRIREVPKEFKGYAVYSRFHRENSQKQKSRRFAKRHNISYEEALGKFSAYSLYCKCPYIQMQSMTNRHSFKLFIKKKVVQEAVCKDFGSYGLSGESTVPEF